ncbi:hypothetical protein [Bifidobacterium asteroides]|nr:hypothetical protein [Bifidobacterium asteroides]
MKSEFQRRFHCFLNTQEATMSQMRKRRSFGTIKKVTQDGRSCLEASFPAPLYCFHRYLQINLPARQHKVDKEKEEQVLDYWLKRAERDIELNVWVPQYSFYIALRRNVNFN